MIRPRASRSSSHRDERWEGCRVLCGMIGQGFSWTRTALNLEAWTPSPPSSGPCFRGAVPVAFLWLSLWVWAWSLLGLYLSPLVRFFFWWGPTPVEERAPTKKPAVIRRFFFWQARVRQFRWPSKGLASETDSDRARQCEGVGIKEGVPASQSALLHRPELFLRWGSHSMSSCDGVRPIVVRAGAVHLEGIMYTPHEGPASEATSRRAADRFRTS